MTEIDVRVILNLTTNVENTGREPVLATVVVERNNKMEEKNMATINSYTDVEPRCLVAKSVSLRSAANYLVRLFYQTNQEYSCTRTKIGKMLSIAAFKFSYRGERLFDETIYEFDGCGVAINELRFLLDREVYQKSSYKDNKEIIKQELDTTVAIPNVFKTVDMLPIDVRDTLMNVFRKFGAYTARDLGTCLNPIVRTPGVVDEDGRVQLEWFTPNNLATISLCEECQKIIEYIKQ